MPKLLPQELIAKIREEVKKGKSRYNVADELGINVVAVYNHTTDLPKRKVKRLSKEEKDKIIEKRMQGSSIHELAKEYGVNSQTIYMTTRCLTDHDKPSTGGNFGIRGRTFEILQFLVKEGYYISKKGENISSSICTLSKYFSIKKIEARKSHIYLLEGKDKVAFQAFMRIKRFKTIGYHELCSIASLFDANFTPEEKREMISKNNPEEGDDSNSLKVKKQSSGSEQPQNFNDFGRFLH